MENLENVGVRAIDELGRIVLPRAVREKLGWKDKNRITIYYLDEEALLLKFDSAGSVGQRAEAP